MLYVLHSEAGLWRGLGEKKLRPLVNGRSHMNNIEIDPMVVTQASEVCSPSQHLDCEPMRDFKSESLRGATCVLTHSKTVNCLKLSLGVASFRASDTIVSPSS